MSTTATPASRSAARARFAHATTAQVHASNARIMKEDSLAHGKRRERFVPVCPPVLSPRCGLHFKLNIFEAHFHRSARVDLQPKYVVPSPREGVKIYAKLPVY